MLKIAICDDEATERQRLREWLTGYLAARNQMYTFAESEGLFFAILNLPLQEQSFIIV